MANTSRTTLLPNLLRSWKRPEVVVYERRHEGATDVAMAALARSPPPPKSTQRLAAGSGVTRSSMTRICGWAVNQLESDANFSSGILFTYEAESVKDARCWKSNGVVPDMGQQNCRNPPFLTQI
jgi:hypothetical protein